MSLSLGIWAFACATIGVGCEEEPVLTPLPDPVPLEQSADGTIALPSGLVVRLHETRLEPKGVPTHSVNTVRLRYVAPNLGDTFSFEQIEGDFTHLCATFGLMTRAQSAPDAGQIIISIASQQTAFGESAPNVVQYFDAFSVQNDACIWEGL
ncbi:DUF6497 family protein [uncultured Litoreibacter sp.]|uniref:DUF6497 family protein n=1 Tax=uncultured Litoreibacter sp. TaxID=1392394 RepID=UPI002609ABBA|nr:DUF6497 family protein [uncultured Litoreibacter sp.]